MRVVFNISSVFVVIVVVLYNPALGEEDCEADRQTPFNRIFHVFFRGANEPLPTESTLRWALGDCGKLTDFAQEAITYFEKYTDLSVVKRNPYIVVENDDYVVVPNNVDNTTNYRIVAESDGTFATGLGTPLTWISWKMSAKKDLVGPGGTLKAEQLDVYALYRFMTDGKEACVKLWAREPMSSAGTFGSIDFSTRHDEWGDGVARGLWTAEKGIYDLFYTFTWPADPFYY